MSSRLYQQIRDEQGLVYDIGSNYHPYRAAGLIIVEGVTTNENFLPVVHGIISTLASLATRPVGEEELWRAQERLRAEVLLGAESSNIRMSQLGTQEIYFGSYIPLDEVVAAIRAISPEDITQIAAELFQPGNLGLAAIGAFENTPGLAEYLEGLIGLD
jgi:predicted Zn-dependent peptidase